MNKNIIFALVSAVVLVLMLLMFSSQNAAEVLRVFFTAPFSSVYYLGNMLNTVVLILIPAIGTLCSLKVGAFNLGGNGQIYAGGFITAAILVFVPSDAPVMLLAFVCTVIVTALMAILPALLRVYKNTSEVLTTFLLASAVTPIIDYCIAFPLRDQTKNLLATPFIADQFRLKSLLPPSHFNISFFIALAIFVAAVILLQTTVIGYKMRVTGIAPEFAQYVGFGDKKILLLGMGLSGALHGLGGFFAIIGTYFTCYQGFVGSLGWIALSAAILSKQQVALVLPVSLLFAYLSIGAERAIVVSRVSFDISNLMQGVIFFLISLAVFNNVKSHKGLVKK